MNACHLHNKLVCHLPELKLGYRNRVEVAPRPGCLLVSLYPGNMLGRVSDCQCILTIRNYVYLGVAVMQYLHGCNMYCGNEEQKACEQAAAATIRVRDHEHGCASQHRCHEMSLDILYGNKRMV